MQLFDFDLGESADMIRETTRRFAADKIAPLAKKVDADDWFPRDELWASMGELGLHGITVAEEYGGLGLGYLEHVIACEEIARASGAIGLSYGAHTNLCINQIARWARPNRRRNICRSSFPANILVAWRCRRPGPVPTSSR